MSPGEVLGLSRHASATALRAAALAELGLHGGASDDAIRNQYRCRVVALHPDRVTPTAETQRAWERLQAAMSILKPPRDTLTDEEASLWQETIDFAEPFSAGVVEGVGELLAKWASGLRAPRAADAGTPSESPSLLRNLVADTAQAAVTSGQRQVLVRLTRYFERVRNGKA